jgi:hypothetical protein
VAAAVAVYAGVEAERIGVLVLGLGLASAAALAAGLAGAFPAAVTAGLAGVGAAWAVSAWTQGADAPEGTILAAAAIFVAADLAFWSLDQTPVPDEPELLARRSAGLALRGAGALALAALMLVALGLHARGGLVLEAVGVAAAVGLVALVFALARHEDKAPER